MEYKKIEYDNYTMHLLNTDRFKIMNVIIYFTKKFDKSDIPYGSLLCSNLVYTSKKYNTKNKMAIIGEELFGAKVSASFEIVGNTESLSVVLDFVNPKYTKEEYLEESINFLYELLFNPNIENDGFNEEYFNILKNDAISNINSIKEKPNLYASTEYAKVMFDKTPTAYNHYSTVEEVNKITNKDLYKFYKRLFSGEFKTDVIIYGEQEDNIKELINNKFKKLRTNNNDIDIYIRNKYNSIIKEKTDILPFNQSRLYMGYRIKDANYHEMNYVLRVYNTILGTMNDSLLFNIVREENSLCYSIGSYVTKYNPSLTIYAGINKSNSEKTIELVKHCMELMKDKKTLERLFDSAKKTINTYLNNYYDDAYSQVNRAYYKQFDLIEDIETVREKINNITIEEIININDKISLSTIYLLKGDREI